MVKVIAVGLISILAFTAALRAQAATPAVAVIVNKSNGVESLSMAQLRKLVLGDVREWPGKKAVNVVFRDSSSKVAQLVLSNVVRLNEGEYRRYIMNAEFRGEEPMAVQTANSDLTATKLVAGAEGSIAFVDPSSLPSMAGQVKVVRVNGKLPGEPGYPL